MGEDKPLMKKFILILIASSCLLTGSGCITTQDERIEIYKSAYIIIKKIVISKGVPATEKYISKQVSDGKITEKEAKQFRKALEVIVSKLD